MKKIFLMLAALLFTVSMNAQIVKIYNKDNVEIGRYKASYGVRVEFEDYVELKDLEFNPTKTTYNVGDQIDFSGTVKLLPENVSDDEKRLYWTLGTWNNVLSVDDYYNGKYTALAPGTTTVQVHSDIYWNIYKECEITVVQPATGISLSQTSANLAVGETLSLTATVEPEDASQDVSWTIANSTSDNVVTVENGLVTATGVGEADVVATTADGTLQATCHVVVENLIMLVYARKDAKYSNEYGVRLYDNVDYQNANCCVILDLVWPATSTVVPEGTYVLNSTSGYKVYGMFSGYEENGVTEGFSSATVVVKHVDGKYEFRIDAVTESGKAVKAKYVGSLDGMDDPKVPTIFQAVEGMYYSNYAYEYQMMLKENAYDTRGLVLDFMWASYLNEDGALPCGTYTMSGDALWLNYGDNGTFYGSYDYGDQDVVNECTVTVSKSGNVYHLEVSAKTEYGYEIFGTYDGLLYKQSGEVLN